MIQISIILSLVSSNLIACLAMHCNVCSAHVLITKAKRSDWNGLWNLLDDYPGIINVQPLGDKADEGTARWPALHQALFVILFGVELCILFLHPS